jgi:hypothetical protein
VTSFWLAVGGAARAGPAEEARLLSAADASRYDNRALEALEPQALRDAGSSAVRDGPALRLRLSTGKVVTYRNTPDCAPGGAHEAACTAYGLVAHLRGRHLFVLDVRPYEGGSFLLVDDRTGRATELPDFPELSANGRLALIAQNSDAYGDGGMEVWRKRNGRFVREWRGDPAHTTQGPTYYHLERWTRGGEAIVRVETVSTFGGTAVTSRLRLHRVGRAWRAVAQSGPDY